MATKLKVGSKVKVKVGKKSVGATIAEVTHDGDCATLEIADAKGGEPQTVYARVESLTPVEK